jgi:tRNA1Val (adenine37-N6)-methyltransferase
VNDALHDEPNDEVSLDRLTAGIEVFQRVRGHRFSSDDTTTAWAAMQLAPTAARVLDLGCGLGSVLLHLAWCLPNATLVGVEAQAVSFGLLRRNVEHNRLGHRVAIHHGDLRDTEVLERLGGPFDLVTGTPPYFPPDTATDAMDEQRAYARIEYRGGVEAYVAAAAMVMADDGRLVLCGDSDAEHRTERAAHDHDLVIDHAWTVLPRAERPPLFSVWALRRASSHADRIDNVLTLRDEHGERTADARVLRAFSGFPERDAT